MTFFLTLSAVSAGENENITSDNLNNNDIVSSVETTDVIKDTNSSEIQTSLKSSDNNIVKGDYFTATLTYENGTGIENKSVQFSLNGVVDNGTTDSSGVAKFLINTTKGTYKISYNFKEDGFVSSSSQNTILVLTNNASAIKASNYVAYVGFKNPFTVTLSAGGVNLAGRVVTFELAGKKYNVKTNSKGQATLNIDLKKGTYTIKYSYAGETNIKSTSGSAKITVRQGMPTKISAITMPVRV